MKIVILTLCFVLSGCMTIAVPVKRNFPVAPETLLTPCPELKKLEKDAKLSDVAKIVVENYTLYHECSIKSQAWAGWYKSQKKIFEESQ
jgi:hypothetical protein